MIQRIEEIGPLRLVGMRLEMSFAENRTAELWQGFMPHRKSIVGVNEEVLYSLQNYPKGYSFEQFEPTRKFEKWAAVSVDEGAIPPANMETMIVPKGLYALFHYVGLPGDASPFFRKIFQEWLPQSEYQLDDRPHFEKLGERFKKDDSSSEEEVWIPIRKK